MRKNILIIFAILIAFLTPSCKTLTGTMVTLDKSHISDDIIYDLVDTYEIPEIGTMYDYKHKAVVVSTSEYVGYRVKINGKWYEADRTTFNKYKIGDKVTTRDFNKLKN